MPYLSFTPTGEALHAKPDFHSFADFCLEIHAEKGRNNASNLQEISQRVKLFSALLLAGQQEVTYNL